MKKVVYGLLFATLVLSGCGGQGGDGGDAKASGDINLQTTIDSLRTENSRLKSQLSNSEKPQESTSSSQASSESTKIKTYGLNEEAILKDDQGNNIYSLKIIKATTAITPDSVATYDEHTNLIEVVYEYKNYNYPNAMSVSTQYISAYDPNGLAGKDLGYMDGQTEVSSGGKASQSKMWFEMNSDPNDISEIEIDYSNDFSLGFEDTLSFKVPLEH
ncbi:hypothetical protein ABQE15_16630 [Enterococcus gallinarum]|uniref:hypothetical protein n=1 Tax=Enterococcus gallinarum TaxID=1353 RepID=UPI0032E50182